MRLSSLILFLVLWTGAVTGQPSRQPVEVRVVPEHADWCVDRGERIRFRISVVKDGHYLENLTLRYEYGPEKMPATRSEEVLYRGGELTVDAGRSDIPGFVACRAEVEVEGKEYSDLAKVGVDPGHIEAVAEMPEDFDRFWEGEIAALKRIPLDARMTLLPERCTARSDVYHVSFQNERQGSRIYGILSVPKAPGRYPAILNVPGAGVRAYQGDTYLADDGFISLTIGIHGLPVTLDDEVYASLAAGALDRYWLQGLDSRKDFYYRRVYLGLVRSLDFIYTLPQFDGDFVAVSGGSQGGALSIVAAALDKRVRCYTAFYPALCDLTGYLKGRAAGWPAMFRFEQDKTASVVAQKAAVSAYFDVVNFARKVSVPGFFSWGYKDEVCPPTSMYAAYNAVTAPKQLVVYPDTGHWNYPEQWVKKQAFIKSMISRKQ